MMRFPPEEDAVTEEQVLRADEQAAMAEIARLEAAVEEQEQTEQQGEPGHGTGA